MDNKKIIILIVSVFIVLLIVGIILFFALRKKQKNKELFYASWYDGISTPQTQPTQDELRSWVNSIGGKICSKQDLCDGFANGASICAFGQANDNKVYTVASDYSQNLSSCIIPNIYPGVCIDLNSQSTGFFIYGNKPVKGSTINIGGTNYKINNFVSNFRVDKNSSYWNMDDYLKKVGAKVKMNVNQSLCVCNAPPKELIYVKGNVGVNTQEIINWATNKGAFPVKQSILCEAYKYGFNVCGDATPNGITLFQVNQNKTTGCIKGSCNRGSPPTTTSDVFIYDTKPGKDEEITINEKTYKASDIFNYWAGSQWSTYDNNEQVNDNCDCISLQKELMYVKGNVGVNTQEIIAWAMNKGAFPVNPTILCEAYKYGFNVCGNATPNGTGLFQVNQNQSSGCIQGSCNIGSPPTTTSDVFIYDIKPTEDSQIIINSKAFKASDIFNNWAGSQWSAYDNYKKIHDDCDCVT
jgi:hypothetical protein